MGYLICKNIFDLHWHKKDDLRANLIALFSKNFLLHRKSGARGLFAIERDPMRYTQLKKTILDRLQDQNQTLEDVYCGLKYCQLNMEMRQIREVTTSDEIFYKIKFAIEKIELAYPAYKAFGNDLANDYWQEALSSCSSYQPVQLPNLRA